MTLLLMQAPSVWNQLGNGTPNSTGMLPTGAIIFVSSGSCPSYWTEQSLAGNYILLTTHGNGDAGTTGGSTSYTPAGTNATAAFTPTGTNATAAFTPSGTLAWPAGVPTFSGSGGTVPAQIFTGNAGTVPAQVFSGTQATIQPTFIKLIACMKS